eukprot:352926-Chlamydomonas_euryale.AAC.3
MPLLQLHASICCNSTPLSVATPRLCPLQLHASICCNSTPLSVAAPRLYLLQLHASICCNSTTLSVATPHLHLLQLHASMADIPTLYILPLCHPSIHPVLHKLSGLAHDE